MYEKSYGSKYVRGGDYRPAADIAKDMRADIKAAIDFMPGRNTNR